MGERQITSDELDVVRWLLVNAANKDVSEYSAESLQGAAVVVACPCGCASIDFSFGEDPADVPVDVRRATDIVAEGFALWPDGTRAGVMLWGRRGQLLGIELYDLGADAARRFPTVQVLRRWEDYFDIFPANGSE
jgi:hypothetical protein